MPSTLFLFVKGQVFQRLRESGPPGAPVEAEAAHPDFDKVYDAWFDRVASWVAAMGAPPGDRDDLVQDVFLIVLRRLPSFDGENIAAWLYQITRRRVRDFRRDARTKETRRNYRALSQTIEGAADRVADDRALVGAGRADGRRAHRGGHVGDRDDLGGVQGWVASIIDVTDRKQAEAASRRLTAIVESSDDAIIGKDLEDAVTSWNKAAERIFHQSQRAAAPGEAARTAAGEPFHAGKASSVERVFGSEENKQRLKELIGEDRMQDFEQLAKLLRGGEAAESAFAGSGGFAAQQQIQRMLRGGLFSYLPQWAEQKLVASLYFMTPVRAILTNQLARNPNVQAAGAAAVRAAVLSQPFMSAMAEDFGDKSSTFIDKILDSLDMYESQGRAGKAAVGKQDWVEQLIREADKTNPNRQRVFPIQ